ncbi:MAG TPA: hypothetical protein VFB59_03325 [Candidatus Saccharimonadales bacterium]|nr:hypothetical protein [Candidatus Saccharimonadales bacterium]
MAQVADGVTYDSVMRIMDAEDRRTDAAREQFFADTNELCSATSPLTIPLQLGMRRRERREIADRMALGLDKPIDKFYAAHPKMWQKLGAKKFLEISGTATTGQAICATVALLMSMDAQDVYRGLCEKADEAELSRAYHNALGHLTPSPRRPLKATRDLEIANTSVRKGQLVEAHFSSANRSFPGADMFDPTRLPKDAPHIAFGIDAYECPGQGLSRANFLAVMTALAPHLPKLLVKSLKIQSGIIYRTREFVLAAPQK